MERVAVAHPNIALVKYWGKRDVALNLPVVPSLSLIDAQQALSLSDFELVGATYEQQLAILRLQASMGILGKQSAAGAM